MGIIVGIIIGALLAGWGLLRLWASLSIARHSVERRHYGEWD